MYIEHPVFETPQNGNLKIWRYMDFTKFLCIIEKQSLFFPRADKFEDVFEGSYTEKNQIWRVIEMAQFEEDVTLAEVKARYAQYFSQSSKSNENMKRYILVNCWHMNEIESAAMWKLYSHSNEAIAIQSTIDRLKNSFETTNEKIYIGKVNYIDYDTQIIPEGNFFTPYLYKRLSFEHEHEVRAVTLKFPPLGEDPNLPKDYWLKDSCEHGLDISVNIDTLIENIFVSPFAPQWLFELIRDVVLRYKIGKRVIYSDLKRDPFF